MEGLVRTFSPESNMWDFHIPLERKGFRITGIPNFRMEHKSPVNEFQLDLKINALGFREQKKIEDSEQKDLVILGDSYAFGYGVEEDKRFGNILQKSFLDSIKCFNLGIPSCHFLNAKRNLEHAVQAGLTTENMIFAVCMENDLLNYETIQEPTISVLKSIKSWFHKNSSLYNFVGRKVHDSKRIEHFLNWLGLVDKLEERKILEQIDQNVESSAQLLENLTGDFNTLILIVPSRFLWIGENQEKTNLQHQKFVKELRQRSMKVLDMKPIFESLSTQPFDDFYFKIDGHWNEKGHQVVGQTLFNEW